MDIAAPSATVIELGRGSSRETATMHPSPAAALTLSTPTFRAYELDEYIDPADLQDVTVWNPQPEPVEMRRAKRGRGVELRAIDLQCRLSADHDGLPGTSATCRIEGPRQDPRGPGPAVDTCTDTTQDRCPVLALAL